jgi:uncharacterized SAM-binding protein YcdF (DUF218 family)
MKFLAVIALLALCWLVGLVAFASRVASSTPAFEPPTADAIVALTGASSIRIEAAVQLLEEGKGRRLLISGVNPQARRSEVKYVARGVGRIWDCCVDLGFRAETTRGNAVETARWVEYHRYRSLIVVTADYHIPRAVLELHSTMPGVELYPYPVVTDTVNARRWWARWGDTRRITVEYCKYLAILTRELGRTVYHRFQPAPARPDAPHSPHSSPTRPSAASPSGEAS